MAVRVCKGNLLERAGTTGVTQTAGSSHSVLGLANLYSDAVDWPWRAGAAAAANTIQINGDLLKGAGIFTSLTGWTDLDTGSGASSLDLVTFHVAPSSLKLSPGAGGLAKRTYATDLVVRAGEYVTVQARCQGSGSAAGPVKILVYIPELNLYWNGSAWTSTPSTAWTVTAGGSFALTSTIFQIPNFSTVMSDTCSLRISPYNDGTADSWIDELVVFPSIDLVSVHGHTLLPRHALTVDSSVDASSWTNRLTLSMNQPSFYGRISSPVAAQYWRFSCADPLVEGTPMIGHLGFWLSTLITAEVRHPALNAIEEPMRWTQERIIGPSGAAFVTKRGPRQLRQRPLSFRAYSLTAINQLLDEVVNRSEGGVDLVGLIPLDTEPTVLLGRPAAAASPRRVQNTFWDTVIQFDEEPGPDESL